MRGFATGWCFGCWFIFLERLGIVYYSVRLCRFRALRLGFAVSGLCRAMLKRIVQILAVGVWCWTYSYVWNMCKVSFHRIFVLSCWMKRFLPRLSLSCCSPVALLLLSCRSPVALLLLSCRSPVAPCRSSLSLPWCFLVALLFVLAFDWTTFVSLLPLASSLSQPCCFLVALLSFVWALFLSLRPLACSLSILCCRLFALLLLSCFCLNFVFKPSTSSLFPVPPLLLSCCSPVAFLLLFELCF